MNFTIPWPTIIGIAASWLLLGPRGAVGFALGWLVVTLWRNR